MIEKQCTNCKVVKPFYEFHRDARTIDGKQSQCRDFQNEIILKWRQNNPKYMHNSSKNNRE